MKARQPRTTKLKQGPAAARHRGSSALDLRKQLDGRTRDLAEAQRRLTEALEQQTATSQVLQIISSSPGELATVFKAVLENAIRLCEAKFGVIYRYDGHLFCPEGLVGVPQPLVEFHQRRGAFEAVPGTPLHRLWQTRDVVRTEDDAAGEPPSVSARFGGARSHVAVPMLKGNALVGSIIIYRQEVRPFGDAEVELVRGFAKQAVIATENARLFDEIQDKSRQLAEASKHKSQFLANMSHELRTPLNAILGYTELILDGVYGETSEKMREALDRVERNGKHLLGLINDVLDLSKIEAGQLTLSVADYSLEDIVNAVHAAVAPLAAEKKLRFELEVQPDLPRGHGDEHRLRQVLLNLAGNAIKFTDNGEVRIRATVADGMFTVAVRDTGPGISTADQRKLFQEFQQADNSITRNKGGTGLGLAISKRIVEMHKGKIWLESRVGEGSTFFFTLPIVVEQERGDHEQAHPRR
jgi:signal transduction histidine kinase